MSRRRKPKARCFQPGFVYTTAVATDIAATFKRIRDALKAAEDAKAKAPNVAPIKRKA